MSVDVACVQCHHRYVGLDEKLVGQSFQCACGAEVHITEAHLRDEAKDARPEQSPPAGKPAHITVVCPGCGHEFVGMDSALAGQQFNCVCGRQLHIQSAPVQGSATATAAADQQSSEKSARQTQRAKGGNAGAAAKPPRQARHAAVVTGMMQAVCPTCEHLYHSIPPQFAGRRFKCQTCSTSVRIPQKPGPTAATRDRNKSAGSTAGDTAQLDFLSLATEDPDDAAARKQGRDEYAPPPIDAFDYEEADHTEQEAAGSQLPVLIIVILAAILVILLLLLAGYLLVTN